MSESTTSAGPPSMALSLSGASRIEKIDPRKLHACDRVHRQDIDRDHAAARAHALGRHLAPAAGRRTEIDHARARLQNAMLVVDLGELEGGARATALALGARHVRIVELALQPTARGLRLALVLDADLEPPLARDRRSWSRSGRPHTPSSRIICTSMPSRRPRSATRRRGHGNARRIASRMAQPASTRSARSAPMHGFATRPS